jgi:hypothetical protein
MTKLFQPAIFDSANLPVGVKTAYLGHVKILRYHAEEDFWKAFLAGDPRPVLTPNQEVTTLTADKGRLY